MFIKLGEQIAISTDAMKNPEFVLSDPEINARFEKIAKELKKVAPKADDFLYFTTRFITAAEASLINEDGSPKLDRVGKPITANWEKVGDGMKWICSDASIRPYKNNNGDIFPEAELIEAIPKWVRKPLCQDHVSNSADGVRGIILDTHYDTKHKCGWALVALDRTLYPELARKVSSGYAASVSMGTRVGVASCTECFKGCRSEKDFCHHMQTRTHYGEVNSQLDPLEISIVVSPADTTAKVRTVFAAYQSIKDHQYSFNAHEKIAELQNNLWKAGEQLRELRDLVVEEEKTANDQKSPENPAEIEPLPYGQSSGRLNDPQDETDSGAISTLPAGKYADINALISELKILKSSMEQTLKDLLTNQPNKEEQMSDNSNVTNKKAYWLGGGGVNEPTPGKVKYPIDPLEGQARKEDKQMVGQPPFPGVGDVEGLHPSPASADVKDELARKEMLRRAEEEQRDQRRKDALNRAKSKLGYWLGGGGVNEPTPGKVKYPIDPEAAKARMEDKPMVGQPPFPGVGDVEGLHPSPASADVKDELERKKMLARASLKAAFHKAANLDGTLDCDNSGWRVFAKDEAGEKLIFTASVKELSGNRSEALFDMIATKDFGSKMLEKIRTVGIEKAASLFKAAQAVTVPAGPEVNPTGGVAGMPADTGGASPLPAMDMAGPADETAEDAGGKGDPKDTALKLAEKVRDDASDLLEAVRLLTGESAEMSDLEQGIQTLPKSAASTLKQAAAMRKQLNQLHVEAARKSLSELKLHFDELKMIAETADGEVVKNASINKLIGTAFVEASQARQNAQIVLRSYARYAQGVEGLEERVKRAMEECSSSSEEDVHSADDANAVEDANAVADGNAAEDFNLHSFEKELGDEDMEFEDEPELEHADEEVLIPEDVMLEEPLMADDLNQMNEGTVVKLPPGQPVPAGAQTIENKQASFDLTSKEGRAAYRAKLAKDLGEVEDVAKLKFSPILDEANSLTNGQTKLDTKPSDSLGLVETLPEVQKRMMEVAKAPPKVRKEAETLNQLIAQGAVHPSQLDQLVAEGLDAEVVKYWRQYYGQAGKEGSEFARLLTTETMQAKAQEEIETHKVKLARSYDLANEMVRRGLINDTQAAIAHQVEEIMKWNDDAYASMKRVVAKYHVSSMKKEASIPQVGMIGSGDPLDSSASADLDLQAQLDQAFANRRY